MKSMQDLRLLDDKQTRYVFSTGRTGTTLLREFIKKRNPEFKIAFEPSPSRQAFILWSAGMRGLMQEDIGRNLIYKWRRKELLQRNEGQIRIEFDSYLSPLVAEMLDYSISPIIVHMVRHPYSWIRSAENFKAAHWRRFIIDYLPFAKLIPPKASTSWSGLNTIERSAWRWVYYNEKLLECEKAGQNYLCVKYEDFISSDSKIRNETVNKILHMLDPQHDTELDIEWSEKMNESSHGKIDHWQDWPTQTLSNVREICGDLMDNFGYQR